MADGYGIDKLEEYIDSLRDGGVTFEIQNLSKEVQQVLTYLVKMWDQTVKGDVPTQKELKELQKGFYAYLQSSQTTTKETRNYVSMMFTQLLARIDKLDKNRALHSMNANISNMVNSGILDTGKKGAQNNVLAQLLKGGFLSPVTNSITSFQDKLMSFLNIEKGQEKTKKRQFVEDLVEGLARSKFVGGALSDFIKLGALFIASWAKDKGLWGKVLAVGLVAAAPIIGAAIAGLIVKGVTTLFTKAVGLIGKGIWNVAKWVGGKLFSWMGKLLSAIWASKALGGLRGALAGLGIGGRAASVAKAGAILAPGTSGFLADAMLAGGGAVAQNTAKAGILKGIWGVVKKIGPWLLRAGKLFNVVGWIWLGIEAILGIIKWWKNRKSSKGKDKGISGSDNIGIEDVSNQNVDSDTKGGSQQVSKGAGTLGNRQVTSGFGWRTHPVYGDQRFHTGIDLAYNKGEAVNALMGGKVISAQWQQGYGNTVRIQDKNGYIHLYGHLDSLGVKPGQTVKRGQYLGAAGMTGTATGVHTHYGVAKDASWAQSSWVNPLAYLGAYEPDALKKGEKSGLKYKDKTTQNIVEYWNSKGEDKGFLHTKARDYAKLAEQFKHEYVQDVAKISKKGYINGEIRDMKYLEAYRSQEAKDYANKKMAEYVASAKAEAITNSTSIRVGAAANAASINSTAEEIKDLTPSATDQARAQWARINKEFKEDAEKQIVVPSDKQPLIDFSGTETCSKVLQNVINAQQQAYIQR